MRVAVSWGFACPDLKLTVNGIVAEEVKKVSSLSAGRYTAVWLSSLHYGGELSLNKLFLL